MNEANNAGRPGARFLRFGVSLLAVGALLAGYAGFVVWPMFSSLFFNPAHTVPGEFQQQLDEGIYLLSVQTASSTRAGPISVTRGTSVEVLALTIRDPNGVEVSLANGRNQTVTRNGDRFSGFVVFTADETGAYEFNVSTSAETNVLVTRSITSFPVAVWVMGVAGAIAFVAGVALAIAGFARSRSQHRVPAPPTAHPLLAP